MRGNLAAVKPVVIALNHLDIRSNNLHFSATFRCRHGAIAKYFGEEKPTCNKACDYCRNPIKVDTEVEHMLRGVYANSNPKKRQGKTGIKEDSGEVDGDLYGGGRRGAKQSVLTTLSLKQMQYNHFIIISK